MRFRWLQTRWLLIPFLLLFAVYYDASAQSLTEQKSVVTFIFGTAHPLGADKKPLTDTLGKPIEVEMPLGTGFFVGYPDPRGGPTYAFCYLVTAKHVLKDFDGKFFKKVKLRLNLLSLSTYKGFDLETEVTVSDENGNLLWHHTKDDADDLAIVPLLPDVKKYDFKSLPISMFVNDANLKSNAVEEGQPLTMTIGNDFNTGVSFIVPAPRIKEILDSPDFQLQRETEGQQFLKAKHIEPRNL